MFTIHSIRFKLIASLFLVSLLIGMVSLVVGGNLIYRSVVDEANSRIRQDLSSARVIYDDRVDAIYLALEIAASRPGCLLSSRVQKESITRISNRLGLDFSGIIDDQGRVCFKTGPAMSHSPPGPVRSANPFVAWVLENRKPVAGTIVMTLEQLDNEAPFLTGSPPGHSIRESGAMVIGAAVPVYERGRFKGIIYGGVVLNKDTGIVDKIMDTVFENEVYEARNLGTATIFHNDLRIATSVKNRSGTRALGTRASPDVVQKVLDDGDRWLHRAMVVDEWYITAYEPIEDIRGQRVGMLYVGVLEEKYEDVRQGAMTVYTGITLAGVMAAIGLGWLFTGRIMRPVSHLIRASNQISKGNLTPDIGPISKSDIGQLQERFLNMTQALREREARQKTENETRLIQSQKQASVGRLAAGVAHEINNPLTAVLTFTHLILNRNDLPKEVRTDLEMVATQTERVRDIVKSLLDFSRQTEISPEALDINELIQESVRLMENQALVKGVDLRFEGTQGLPRFILDRNQFQSVVINMIINSLDAISEGGKIFILTRKTTIPGNEGVDISIEDTGSGISKEDMDQIFDPFFTTKDVGKGTGLGLAVSAGIVQRHGGTITVRSTPGEGTCFTIWLPGSPDKERKE